MDPRLILFLKKLRSVAVTDAVAAVAAAAATATAAATANISAEGSGGSAGQQLLLDGCSNGSYDSGSGSSSSSIQVHKQELGGGLVSLRWGPAGALRQSAWLIVSDSFTPSVDRCVGSRRA